MSANVEKRKLSELGVVDLRSELEKRDLDKSGLKQVLVERLQKALQEAGEDPTTFEFQVEKKSTKRLSNTSGEAEAVNTKDKMDENVSGNVKANNATDQKEKVDSNESFEKKDSKALLDTSTLLKSEFEKKDNENKIKEESGSMTNPSEEAAVESENLIQLTLDEQEASFQDEEEIDSTGKTDTNDRSNKEDEKSTFVNADTTKEKEDTGEKMEDKMQEGNSSSIEASNNKSSSNSSSRTHRQNRNLWITNITQTTKATELKQVLSAYGKVIGAKVVINAKYPGACCYGYVTMDTIEDADNCITKLNNTELNGKIIRIEKVRPDHMNTAKLDAKKKKPDDEPTNDKKEKDSSHRSKSRDHKSDDKKKDSEKEKKIIKMVSFQKHQLNENLEGSRSRDHSRGGPKHDSTARRSRSGREILTFDKIKEERERQRIRERERMLREESRRRREEAARQRDIDRLQRSEAARLEREREKLRFEREKLEREKAEIIRLERERQKVEREKLELEKLQLQRVKMRLQEEELRPVKRPAPFRREGSYEDRKRASTTSKRYDEPSGMRYQSPKFSIIKFYCRIAKDSRYVDRERDRSPHYRRSLPEHKGDVRTTHERSYNEASKERDRNSGGGTWGHPNPSPNKPFNTNSGMPFKAWGKDTWRPEVSNNGDRWNSGNVPRGEPSCPAPPAMENYTRGRFDYKPIRSIRKY
ncbi:hypothetical protein RI129_010497 [Pyrocoelia pectoralis]|uniref:SAFB-like transcription modulator n=1 Tax=Pyrocoelia pectoralis TaxID=417401 RepID=A0AAN7V4P6_9COLE